MRTLTFKGRYYRYYAPVLYRAYRLLAILHSTAAHLKRAQFEWVSIFYWDRYLAGKFYHETHQFNLQPFSEHTFKPKGDRIFILGCGQSIASITPEQWGNIGKFDTLAVNYFYCHDFKPNCHMIELGTTREAELSVKKHLLENNSRSNEYVFFHLRHLLYNSLITPFQGREKTYAYSPSILKSQSVATLKSILRTFYKRKGLLIHHASNLDCAVHVAYQLGYKKIFLLGVDLNNQGYFWDVDGDHSNARQDVKKSMEADYSANFDNQESGAVHPSVDPFFTDRCQTLKVSEYLKLLDDVIFKPSGVELACCNPSSELVKFVDCVSIEEACGEI